MLFPPPRGSCLREGRAPAGMCGCPGSQGALAQTSQRWSQSLKVKDLLNCLYLLQHQKSVRQCWTWGDKTDFLPTWETKASDLVFPYLHVPPHTQMRAVVVTCLHVLAEKDVVFTHVCVRRGQQRTPGHPISLHSNPHSEHCTLL